MSTPCSLWTSFFGAKPDPVTDWTAVIAGLTLINRQRDLAARRLGVRAGRQDRILGARNR